MKKQQVHLSDSDLQKIEAFIRKGSAKAGRIKRAMALRMLHFGSKLKDVSAQLGVSIPSVYKWVRIYKESGLPLILADKPRSGRPVKIDGEIRAKVTALACSAPPDGYDRWSLRLLADRLVELEICEPISHTDVGRILKKTNCSLTAKDNGASAR